METDDRKLQAECPVHGVYLPDRHRRVYMDEPACPHCAEPIRAARQRRSNMADGLQESHLRGRFRETTLDNFNAESEAQRRVLAACRHFVEGPPNSWRSMFLIGPPGGGKSHLASAMALEFMAQGLSADVMSGREIIKALRDTWRRDAEQSEEQVLQSLACRAFFAVDEIGIGSGSDNELTLLFDFIDRRYQLRRPTVICSNLPMAQIKAFVGSRIFDRLRDNAQVLACDWPSHRGVRA